MAKDNFNFMYDTNDLGEWLRMPNEEMMEHGVYNLKVYVKDDMATIGILFYLHTLGYQNYYIEETPWQVCEMATMNHCITLTDGKFSFGSLCLSNNPTDEEILQKLNKNFEGSKSLFQRTKEFINCGLDYELFVRLAEIRDDDDSTKLYINGNFPDYICNGDSRWKKFPDDADEACKKLFHIASTEEIMNAKKRIF